VGLLRVDVLDAVYLERHVGKDAYCEFYLNKQMMFKTEVQETDTETSTE
jgi:hypothetical protein